MRHVQYRAAASRKLVLGAAIFTVGAYGLIGKHCYRSIGNYVMLHCSVDGVTNAEIEAFSRS